MTIGLGIQVKEKACVIQEKLKDHVKKHEVYRMCQNQLTGSRESIFYCRQS
jgi:hypothetical protein